MAATAVVEFLLKYSESGGELPAKVKRELDALGQGHERLGRSAFGATEGLTHVRRAMESVALSATGVPGPIGRVATGLLQFGAGGTVTTAVVAGLGAIALGISAIVRPTTEATAALTKFTEGLRSSETPMDRYQTLLGNLQAGMTRTTGLAIGAISGAVATGSPIGQAIAGLIQHFTGKAIDAAVAAATAAGDAVKVAMQELAEAAANRWTTKYLDVIKDLSPGQQVAALLGARASFEAAGRDAARAWHRAWIALQKELQAERIRLFKEEEAARGAELGTFKAALLPQQVAAIAANTPGAWEAAFGAAAPRMISTETREQMLQRRETADTVQAEKTGDRVGQHVAAAVLALAGGIRQGSLASITAGLGGAASSIASISKVAKAVPVLGDVGEGLSALGGLFGLFGGGPHRVTIARLEEQAIEDMKQVQQVPQNVSVVVAGQASGRATKYALDYQTGLDTSSRLPV